ncbi:MAG: response regulator [Gemmatimonadetes bacterium]|nr:MAG: response regulator [Gemmatimonadota bacterium]
MHNQRFMGEVGRLWVSWILLAIVSTSKAQTGGNSSQISEIPVERLIDLLTFIFHRYEDLMWDVIGVFLVFMLMILALLYNIYHRRQAEEELRQQHRHLENLVEERTRTLQQLNENLEQELRERQQIEASLREAKAAAEAATKAKSSFLATMSHEIRTPMNGVIGMTSLLRGTPLTAEQQEYVEAIRVSGETLLAIINDILDFSKIESGKMELEHVPFDLHQCIEETFDLLSTKALEKRLDLLYLIDSDVPTGITGDITRLRQVLVNLVGNAIKFTEKGEVFVSVTVASRTETGVVLQFAVRDTGIGIPEDRLDRLFQSFSQVDSSITRKFGGTGLGLAICSRLVQLMGGTIWVESRLGSGSTFYFTLPTQSAEVKASRFPVDDAPELAGKRILIVDDNPTNCRILTRQFERWKMRPHAVASGEKAIQALQDAVFDLAILDLHMPGMDGLELAHHIRETFPRHRLPLILLSSTTLTSGMRELFQAAITKPVKLSHYLIPLLLSLRIPAFSAPNRKRWSRPDLTKRWRNAYLCIFYWRKIMPSTSDWYSECWKKWVIGQMLPATASRF